MIDTHLQRSLGRDWGQELKSSSSLKESMKGPGEALEESWFGESAEAASGLLLHSRSHRLELGEVGSGAAHSRSCAVGDAKRTKAAHRNVFSLLSLVFPDHVQGRILPAVSSASL